MSALCQKQTSECLFDHLVGEQSHRIGDGKTERLSGLHIDDQLKLCRRLDREVGRLRAFEDAVDVPRCLVELFDLISTIRDQPA